MKKNLDNAPINAVLKKMGYQYVATCGNKLEAEYKWKTPEGEIRRMKYQRRSGDCGPGGRYLVGISHRRFDEVDDFVFWAEGEKYFLVIPSTWLKQMYDVYKYQAKTTDRQWHVNITFDSGGRQTIYPVNCEENDVSRFAHRVQ